MQTGPSESWRPLAIGSVFARNVFPWNSRFGYSLKTAMLSLSQPIHTGSEPTD
ncbi:hypothetical protein IWQ49_002631 [Labrenzia sp. EL_126]|nr:hypothetical protein [Labrenzia sp. EL_126]